MTTTEHDDQTVPHRIATAEAAAALCARLGDTTSELIALLARETELVRGGHAADIAGLHARKAALSAALAHDMTLVRDNADAIRAAAPQQIEALKEQHHLFRKSLQANQDALAAMAAVAESLLRTIAARVGQRRAGPGTYGKDATLRGAEPPRPAALSLDTSL